MQGRGRKKKALIRILIILALLRPPSKGECILYCLCACSNITVGVKSTDGWSVLTIEVEGKFFLICPSDSTIIGTNQCNLIIKDDFLWWKTKNEPVLLFRYLVSPVSRFLIILYRVHRTESNTLNWQLKRVLIITSRVGNDWYYKCTEEPDFRARRSPDTR